MAIFALWGALIPRPWMTPTWVWGLKIIYMSGYAPEISEAQEASPHWGFLQKPFTSPLLLEKMRQTLDLSRAATSAKK
ncbi:MAG TPA: hypothetical protein VIL63_10575 [Terriglobales bacterium]